MGIVRAAMRAVGGTLADSWLEVLEAEQMDHQTILCGSVCTRKNDKRNRNRKGTADVITDGSVIHVAENQFLVLTDGGKIVDYSAEPGYYIVQTGSAPSMFNGQFDASLKDAFLRMRFGGTVPVRQQAFFINLQEIRDIPFGTSSPLNYFDEFYNAELYLRANGYYSVRVKNPLKFYAEMGARSNARVTVKDLQKSCMSEFLSAFQTAITQMSAEGVRISHVGAKSMALSKHMATILDEDWISRRGMAIESVGINSISYDDSSKKLIDMRNQGAMLGDSNVREGYIQGAAARGMEAAGDNPAGSASAFLGMNIGMQQAGSFVAAAGENNRIQQQQAAKRVAEQADFPTQDTWDCACGHRAAGKFCSECGAQKPQRKFCSECGAKLSPAAMYCCECGHKV